MTAITHEALLQRNQARALGVRTVIAEKMTLSPPTIGRHEELSRAREVMLVHGLRHLLVLDGGKLVGVLLQRDVHSAEAMARVGTRVDSVGEAMLRETYVVAPGELVADVTRTMAHHPYDCAVVVVASRVVTMRASAPA